MDRRILLILLTSVGLFTLSVPASAQTIPWMNRALPPEKRVSLLLDAMTQDEKFQQLVGEPGVVAELPQCFGGRHVPGIARLRIPTFRVTNGPVGVGQNDCVPIDKSGGNGTSPGASMMSPLSAKATALPSAMTVAASWDRATATAFGDLLGKEARNLALHVMEAPGVNLARVPQGGRNFEYLGEDPFLSGSLAVAGIRAIQRRGIIAMPKHFVANEQETDRKSMDVTIDDRSLHELYLLPFEMAVKDGDAASVMCSYNFVNARQMCENRLLLTDVLRGQWGFKGYVQSDFFAVQSLAALRAGTDHEMPGYRLNVPGLMTWYTPENLRAALAKGDLTAGDIDRALGRRYLQMFRLGIFDRPVVQTPIDVAGDAAIAARIGEAGAVLLKNDGDLLPFDARKVRRIVLIGKARYAGSAVVGGGGSSEVIPFRTTNPLDGMRATLATIGARADVTLVTVADDNANLAEAVVAARGADAVILLAGTDAAEGSDLPTLALPRMQDAMIAAVAAANPRTALVLKDNAVSLMPWIDTVPAVLEAWFPGQEDGTIVSRLLFGLATPSCKLPVTVPRRESDLAAHTPAQFPGIRANNRRRVAYSEGLAIGYRWFDQQKITPLFPFGHGLSYTRFVVSNVRVAASGGGGPLRVLVTVRNTGHRRGAEVPQVYLRFPGNAGEPPKRLVAFDKVWLDAGQRRVVTMTIDPAAASHPFGIYDAAAAAWRTPAGRYEVLVGTSSADIVARVPVIRR